MVKKMYVDGPMGQVHIREMGEGCPLILLHQTAWSSVQFQKSMPFFADYGFRCIAIDTPGYGMSDTNTENPSVDLYAESLNTVLEKIKVIDPIILAHHTGASIATKFAFLYPKKIKHLILHGVPIFTKDEVKGRLERPHFDQSPRDDGSHFTERWSYAKNVVGEGVSNEAIHNSVMQFFISGLNEWHGHHAAFKYNIEKDYKELNVPTSIVSNTGDPLHLKLEQLKKIRPDFFYFEIDGGTFHIIFDDPVSWSKSIYENILKELK